MYQGKMFIKKRGRIVLATGLAFVLGSISICHYTVVLKTPLPVIATSVNDTENTITISNQVWEKEYYNTEQMLCLSLVYRYPVVSGGNSKTMELFNKQIVAQRDRWIDDQKDLIDTAQEDNNLCSASGNEVNYRVTYNEKDILSILFEGYLYAGGAHGMPYRMPQTFQVNTGKLLSLQDVTGLEKEQIRTLVNERFGELYKKSPDAFWDNAVELVGKLSYEEYSYYVEQDGVHIFFVPYFVAPYAAGFIEIVL